MTFCELLLGLWSRERSTNGVFWSDWNFWLRSLTGLASLWSDSKGERQGRQAPWNAWVRLHLWTEALKDREDNLGRCSQQIQTSHLESHRFLKEHWVMLSEVSEISLWHKELNVLCPFYQLYQRKAIPIHHWLLKAAVFSAPLCFPTLGKWALVVDIAFLPVTQVLWNEEVFKSPNTQNVDFYVKENFVHHKSYFFLLCFHH